MTNLTTLSMYQDPASFEAQVSGRMSWRMRIVFSLLFFAPAAYFGFQGDLLLAIVIAAAGLGAFSGYRMGALSILTCLGAFAAAIVYAPGLGVNCEQLFAKYLGTSGLFNRGISVVAVALGISLVVWLVTRFTVGRIVRRNPSLTRFNRSFGIAIGMLQGGFAVILFVGGMLVMAPMQDERLASQNIPREDAPMSTKIAFWTEDHVEQSSIGSFVKENNPIEQIPQLNQLERVQRTAAVLSDPQKINDVMSHPAIQALQQRPDVRRAVETLQSDEQIQKILYSGEPMNQEAAMTLLSHPAVLELVDQPDFLGEATKAIEDVGL